MPEDQGGSFDDFFSELGGEGSEQDTPQQQATDTPTKDMEGRVSTTTSGQRRGADGTPSEGQPVRKQAQLSPALHQSRQQLSRAKKLLEGYKQFGSPDEIAQQMGRLKELSGGKTYTDAEAKGIRDRLYSAIPELKDFVESRQGGFKQVADFGEKNIEQMLSACQIVPTEDMKQHVASMVVNEINRSPELRQMASNGDIKVYHAVFNKLASQGMLPLPNPKGMAAYQAKKAAVVDKSYIQQQQQNHNPPKVEPTPHKVTDAKLLENLASEYLGVG